ncbi:SDR family NAD(P)-dependent oxidoreductase [Agromyces sp. NPDC058110]|uniref:SDR family NAD(P)-dependent oxidoreductase n=1 Tax=Agromyces sp. NPDC058110 TaxID=3346345 RepID=UPI0036DC6A9D
MSAHVVVTGGASGLGAVIAETLLARGRPVALVDRDRSAALATADSLERSHGTQVPIVTADLSSLAGIHDAANALTAPEFEIAALVNNAGAWSAGDQYPRSHPDEWVATMTLGLLAPMLLTQRLWDRLAAASGAVVNIGSSGGEGDEPYGSPEYGAAKAGIRRFTSSLGDRADVRVMAVVPGWIGLDRAERQFAALSPEQQRASGPLIPPQQVADCVIDLLDRGRAGEVVELLG